MLYVLLAIIAVLALIFAAPMLAYIAIRSWVRFTDKLRKELEAIEHWREV